MVCQLLSFCGIYHKVTRAIVDFSPEQQQNIAAIVWLYRGQRERFLALVQRYLRPRPRLAEGRAVINRGTFRKFGMKVAIMKERIDKR